MSRDLNLKKSWHPGLLKNQEVVWRKEKEALEERKKILERQKEIQQERERNELLSMQDVATGKQRVKRLEWMYSEASGGSMGSSDNEAYLLGKRKIDDSIILGGTKNQEVESLRKDGDNDRFGQKEKSDSTVPYTSAKDLASKVKDDPLLAIKKMQMERAIAKAREEASLSREKGDRQSRDDKYESRHRSSRHRHRESSRERSNSRDREKRRHGYRSSRDDDRDSGHSRRSRDDDSYGHRHGSLRDDDRESRSHRRSEDHRDHHRHDDKEARSRSSRHRDIDHDDERYRRDRGSANYDKYSYKNDDSRWSRSNRDGSFSRRSPGDRESDVRYNRNKDRYEHSGESSPTREADSSGRVSKASDEERQKRLAAMMQDAQTLEESRDKRVKLAQEEDRKAEEEDKKKRLGTHSGQGSFIRTATKNLIDGPTDALRRGRIAG
ncbi:Cwc25p [Sugiyamaella lignohabitans]|uniref:Pre-mRNA-splicing factor CWC25 n=1 Tax=Sugiyamaella lignohabitans TaxID=796027 RepID=A0A167DIU0_9ASCO|nr:Cwc25p [Sugiyamaella lignohabitans]ANB12964.1 Cwc25p [Sugiyamaella lignohabitans]